MRLAISSGVPQRLSRAPVRFANFRSHLAKRSGVLMKPGIMQLTRTLCGASSLASTLENRVSAAFVGPVQEDKNGGLSVMIPVSPLTLTIGFVGAGAGIVDEDIDAAEFFAHDAGNRFDLIELGHVERRGLDFTLRRLRDVVRSFRKRRLPTRADQSLHPLARERAQSRGLFPYSRR